MSIGSRLLLALSFLVTLMSAALAEDFKEGQVWSYRTRAHEPESTLQINKVESNEKLGSIFHISVVGVKIKNRHAPGGFAYELPHSPVSKKTLDESVVKLMSTKAPHTGFREGYETWKKEFDAGNAGIFTVTVAEIVTIIEKVLDQ